MKGQAQDKFVQLQGTAQSVRSFEQVIVMGFPHKLVHDGGRPFRLFGQDHSSQRYSKLYQLFPHGTGKLWVDRVNVRFAYDERHRVGTVKISARGLEMLSEEIKNAVGVIEPVYMIPKSRLTDEQARELGALNLGGASGSRANQATGQ